MTMVSETIPDERLVEIAEFERPNLHAHELLAKVLGVHELGQTGLSQAETEAFFVEAVFPLVTTQSHLTTAALRLQGQEYRTISEQTVRPIKTVRGDISKFTATVRAADAASNTGGLHATLLAKYPHASIVELNPNPTSRRKPRLSPREAVGAVATRQLVAVRATSNTETPARQVKRDEAGNPSADLVRVYLDQAGKQPRIDAEQEVELAIRIEGGVYAQHLLDEAEDTDLLSEGRKLELEMVARDGMQAKKRFLEANVLLVASIAAKYKASGVPYLDIIQDGNLGLIRAVEKFDYTKGYKFSTYATWWIKQSISRNMPDHQRSIHLPVNVVDAGKKLDNQRQALQRSLGREPTRAELASEMDMTPEKLDDLQFVLHATLDLDQTFGEDGDVAFGELIQEDVPDAESTVVGRQMHLDIERMLLGLDDLDRAVVRQRFGFNGGDDWPVKKVCKHFGISLAELNAIERRALARLRADENAEALYEYLSA